MSNPRSPYGPFKEEDLFGTLKRGDKAQYLGLQEICMTQKTQNRRGVTETVDTGLDEILYELPPIPGNPKHKLMLGGHDTVVDAIVRLESDKVLSEKGAQYLQRWCRHPGRPVYRFPMTVQVHMKFTMQVRYTELTLVRGRNHQGPAEGFVMYSSNGHIYEIVSMAKETFDKSHNTYERMRLRHWMNFVLEHAKSMEKNPIPLSRCTPDFWVEQYLKWHRPQKEKEHEDYKRRIIFEYDSEDSDSEWSHDRTGRLNVPGHPQKRQPRHLSKTDVLKIFAPHAEWFLAQHIATASATAGVKVLNVKEWVEFCKNVQIARAVPVDEEDSGSKEQGWGLPHECELEDLRFPHDDPYGLERFGGERRDWYRRLDNELSQLAKRKADEIETYSENINDPALAGTSSRKKQKVLPLTFNYDSDFTSDSDSSSPWGDSDDDSDGQPLDPRVAAAAVSIPHFCGRPATLPRGHTKYQCPDIEQCQFELDILSIPPPSPRRPWGNIHEPSLQKAFRERVEKHNLEAHLWPLNLDFDEGTGRIRWLDKSGVKRSSRLANRQRQIKVKMEPS